MYDTMISKIPMDFDPYADKTLNIIIISETL